jgi:hypothetical protein
MRIPRCLILLALILVTACGTATSTPPQPTATQPPPPTNTPLPAATLVLVSTLLDDFEIPDTSWKAGTVADFTDSSALSVALATEHASQGKQALQLNFEQNDKPKAIFFLDKQLDLSRASSLQFDIYNPGTVGGAGIALTTGAESIWYESDSQPVAKGNIVSLSFDLTAGTYKAASTNWEFRASIADLQDVHRLAIIIYPSGSGSAWVDAIRFNSAP